MGGVIMAQMLKHKTTGAIINGDRFEYVDDLQGWVVDGSVLHEDAAKDYEVVTKPPTISTVEFRNLFTIAEEIAITTSTDPAIKILWSRFTDPKLNNVDMSLKSVQDALVYMTTTAILASGRMETIIAGVAA
jgi:hypothetical protein